jgi:hypothetical protein
MRPLLGIVHFGLCAKVVMSSAGLLLCVHRLTGLWRWWWLLLLWNVTLCTTGACADGSVCAHLHT